MWNESWLIPVCLLFIKHYLELWEFLILYVYFFIPELWVFRVSFQAEIYRKFVNNLTNCVNVFKMWHSVSRIRRFSWTKTFDKTRWFDRIQWFELRLYIYWKLNTDFVFYLFISIGFNNISTLKFFELQRSKIDFISYQSFECFNYWSKLNLTDDESMSLLVIYTNCMK